MSQTDTPGNKTVKFEIVLTASRLHPEQSCVDSFRVT